jgi:P22_AR N-terminal domain/ORF6C domain
MTGDPASALTPIDVRTVEFYGDRITGALVRVDEAPTIYVPMRPICRYLGLDWSAQYRRIQRDEVLSEAARFVAITATNPQGGDPETLCLPLDLLPGFLFGVNAARVKDELREKITRYRRECFRRLWDAFKHDILPATDLAPRPVEQRGAALAYELATAVANLAREQMESERRLDQAARWARRVDQQISDTDQHITALELRLDPQQPINDAQATELAGAVKAVAQALEQRGAANAYQRVYSELYRRYGISSYKRMPRNRYDQALEWLRSWYDELGSAPTARK